MKRYLPIGLAVAVAALALWHPPRTAAPGFAAGPAGPAAHRHASPRPLPSAGPGAVVYVAGAVARPGLYRLAPGARADDAVRLAGGMRPGADPVAVNLAARIADGDEIVVPRIGEATPRPRGRTPRSRRAATPAPASVGLNDAGADALARVPGLGPALAARIVAFRATNGAFANLDELLDVNGMTPARLDRAAPFLRLSPVP